VTSHEIAATAGKIGAIVGMLVTWILLPESKGKSLEEISSAELERIRQHDARQGRLATETP
jgi:hypothetical protein